MYDARRYPEGVPNPYFAMVEPYPSYVHGADYTRPVFSMPFLLNPHNVLAGLGQDLPPGPDAESRFFVYGALSAAVATSALAAIGAPAGKRGVALAGGAMIGALIGLAAVAGGLAGARGAGA